MSNIEQPEIGRFRTPIAAGMLSGIFVAIIYQVMQFSYRWFASGEPIAISFVALNTAIIGGWFFISSSKRGPRAIYGALRGGVLLSVVSCVVIAVSLGMYPIFTALYYTLQYGAYLSGPAIRTRSLRKFLQGMLWALMISILMSVGWQILWPVLLRNFSFAVFCAFHLAIAAISSGVLCRALCALYDLRERRWLIYILAALPHLITDSRELLGYYWQQANAQPAFVATPEFEVFNLMANLIMSLLWIVVPTILIERELRKQTTGPAAPAAVPEASDASSATR